MSFGGETWLLRYQEKKDKLTKTSGLKKKKTFGLELAVKADSVVGGIPKDVTFGSD